MTCYVTTTRAATREEWAEVVKLGSAMSWEQFEDMQNRHIGTKIFWTGDLGPHCSDCAGFGDFLCDYPVGNEKTCDRHMCRDHSHEIGHELHYCDAHYQMWREFRDSGGVDLALKNVIAIKAEK